MGLIIGFLGLCAVIFFIYIWIEILILDPAKKREHTQRVRTILERFDSIQSNVVGMTYTEVIDAMGEKEDRMKTTADEMEIFYDGVLSIQFNKRDDAWICCNFKRNA